MLPTRSESSQACVKYQVALLQRLHIALSSSDPTQPSAVSCYALFVPEAMVAGNESAR